MGANLKVSNKILGKVLAALNQFKGEDLEIIESEEVFNENKQNLETELKRAESGEAKKYSIDEVDLFLEETISKYEN